MIDGQDIRGTEYEDPVSFTSEHKFKFLGRWSNVSVKQ